MISADDTVRDPRADPPSGRTVVRLRGALDIDAAPALRERLNDVLDRGAGLLVLDLSHVASCDAPGLAVLIGAQRRAGLLGIVVRLAAPSLSVTNVLRATGLDRSFTIYPDLSDALALPTSELRQQSFPAQDLLAFLLILRVMHRRKCRPIVQFLVNGLLAGIVKI
jgi:anti-anti-sigma factor